jgi:hypothetical protein
MRGRDERERRHRVIGSRTHEIQRALPRLLSESEEVHPFDAIALTTQLRHTEAYAQNALHAHTSVINVPGSHVTTVGLEAPSSFGAHRLSMRAHTRTQQQQQQQQSTTNKQQQTNKQTTTHFIPSDDDVMREQTTY